MNCPTMMGARSGAQIGASVVLLAAGGLVPLGAGCDFASEVEPGVELANRCLQDEDCPPGAGCTRGMCLAPSTPDLRLALGVEPQPVGSGTQGLPRSFEGVHVGQTLRMPLPSRVFGNVTIDGRELSADITLVPQEAGSDRSAGRLSTTTLAEPVPDLATDPAPADFQLEVVPGIEYLVVVELRGPEAAVLPPLHRRVRFEPTEWQRLDLSYSDLHESLPRRGVLIRAIPEGVRFQVRAYDPQSGRPVSSLHYASDREASATLSFVPGLPETIDRYELRLVPEQAEMEQLSEAKPPDPVVFPTFVVPLGDLPMLEGGVALVEIPPVPAPITFRGVVEHCYPHTAPDPSQGPAPGQTPDKRHRFPVTLRSKEIVLGTDSLLRPSFGASTTTTDHHLDPRSGVFELRVVPGLYQVVVAPPELSPDAGVEQIERSCALYSAEHRLVASESGTRASLAPLSHNGTLLQLPRAPLLRGSVYHEQRSTEERLPVPGTTVHAIANAFGAEAAHHRSAQATVNEEDGSFVLPLDPGTYDVVVRPPAGSGFGWQVFHDFRIGARAAVDERPVTRSIRLGPPMSFQGTLVYTEAPIGSEQAIEGARVTARLLLGGTDATQRSIAVGTTTTKVDGSFELLISPSMRQGLL